jgi:hypothetical protein
MEKQLENKILKRFNNMFVATNRPFHFRHSDGWYDIIWNALEKIERISKDTVEIKISQIKEKFGGLRMYYNNDNIEILPYYIRTNIDEDLKKIILEAERKSSETCEICSKDDNITTTCAYRRMRTLCGECRSNEECNSKTY